MEEHYFLRAWKLRQGKAEEGEREAAPEMEVCFQFLFARAAHRNGEGESHIEAIFFVGSGAAEWNWVIFAECRKGSSDCRNIRHIHSRNLVRVFPSHPSHCACISPGATFDLDYTEDAVFRMR